MKLKQIKEDDLQSLMGVLMDWMRELSVHDKSNRMRTQQRKVMSILNNVQWDYGPHSDVEEVAGDEEPTP